MKWVLKKQWEDVDLIRLAQNMDSWRVLVNPVMNLWTDKNLGKCRD